MDDEVKVTLRRMPDKIAAAGFLWYEVFVGICLWLAGRYLPFGVGVCL